MMRKLLFTLWLLTASVVIANAAPAVVQTQNGSSNPGTGSLTLSSSPTSGNLLVAWIGSANSNSGAILTNLNRVGWNVLSTNSANYSGFNTIAMLYRYVQPGDTATLPALLTSNQNFIAYQVVEVSGVVGNTLQDFEKSDWQHDQTTTTITTTSYNTLANNDLVLLGAFSNTSPAMTGFSGYTVPVNANNSGNYGSWALAWKSITTSGNNISTTFTPGATTRPTGYVALVLSGTGVGGTTMFSSKLNSYGILNTGTVSAQSTSKLNAYDVLNAGTASAISVSKMNAYVVLQSRTVSLFHSFPP